MEYMTSKKYRGDSYSLTGMISVIYIQEAVTKKWGHERNEGRRN